MTLPGSQDLAGRLSEIARRAFEKVGLDPALGAVRRSDRPDLADFQCNGALAAAKAVHRNPRDIAEQICALLRDEGEVAACDIAGPGFINIKVSREALTARAEAMLADTRAGAAPRKEAGRVVIDFGGWNVAKPMHIGHLRSTIIGDSLQRLFRFMGHEVVSDVHLGDWGLQMGLLITEVAREQPSLPYFDAQFAGPYPSDSPVSMDDLERLYPQATSAARADEARRDEARRATAELQAGRPGYRALWRHFCEVTEVGLRRECGALGVEFSLWKGESDAQPFIAGLVEDLKERGIAEFDDGAWIVRVSAPDDKKEIPPLLLVNRDGAVGYHATDLATIIERVRSLDPDRILYVVDQRQALHFEQVFKASDRAGYLAADRLEHIGFGTMNGKDGKPFKTREGGVLKLHDLIVQSVDAATARMQAIGAETASSEDAADVARQVAAAAIKFADLSNVRTTNYVFDLERFISFEGKTGPYLLYAAVRMKSLLRRADAQGIPPGDIAPDLPAERDLILALDGVQEALANAYQRRMPHLICEHAYNLAQAFSAFYAAAPIMAENDERLRGSRIALTRLCLKQLELCLDLVGITVPDRM
jgi:arginyl-tRNA synthetase